MIRTTVRRIGNAHGIVLPTHALEALRVKECDDLCLMKVRDGFRITPCDPDFGVTMKIAEGVMRRYRSTLRDLAR